MPDRVITRMSRLERDGRTLWFRDDWPEIPDYLAITASLPRWLPTRNTEKVMIANKSKFLLALSATLLSGGVFFTSLASAQETQTDSMSQDAMGQDSMSQDGMSQDGMSHDDAMGQDGMSHDDAMGQDGMGHDDAMGQDGMGHDDAMGQDSMGHDDAMGQDSMDHDN
ncbi:MAG: hypothetical protein CMN25_05820 [Salinicola sp.]|nr:hypothetical protein [Salinicola sp.]